LKNLGYEKHVMNEFSLLVCLTAVEHYCKRDGKLWLWCPEDIQCVDPSTHDWQHVLFHPFNNDYNAMQVTGRYSAADQ